MIKKISTKLTLKKETISNLGDVKGGYLPYTLSCNCPTKPVSNCCQTIENVNSCLRVCID